MRRLDITLTFALLLVAAGGRAQPASDPVADILLPRPPLPAGAENPPAVLRPAETPATPIVLSGNRPQAPRRPTFALQPGDRVVFLGDAVLEAEADHGYFETRLESQDPTNRFTFRNLSRSPHNRLREPDPAVAARDLGWLEALRTELRAVDPTVVVLSYGTSAALRGPEALPAFTNVYTRLVDTVLSVNTSTPPRLLLLSPLAYEGTGTTTIAEVTNRNAGILPFAQASWVLSTNRNADFVDLFGVVRSDVMDALRVAGQTNARPRLTEDGLRPTAFGARRLVFAWDRSLRWTANIWRFGLLKDGSWRPGGFGAGFTSHERSDQHMKVVFTEERLPTPRPRVELNVQAESQPHCFIQLRELRSGLYELRVDGQSVLKGTHEEWDRYEVICAGPSWDQAEQLRQAIVEKNARWLEWWNRQPEAARTGAAQPAGVTDLETRIATLKRPVERTYTVTRVGDAPAAPAQPAGR